MIARSLRRLAVIGAVAVAGLAAPAPAQAADLSLDVQLPGSLGESAKPAAFDAVVHNPGAAQPNAQLSFKLNWDNNVPPDHFDITFRNPQTGAWQPIALTEDATSGSNVARTPAFTLPAGNITLKLTIAYHPVAGDARLLDPNEVRFDTTLVAPVGDREERLASDWDSAPIERMGVYIAKLPKQVKGGGAAASFEIRFTNASEGTYEPVRPFLFIEGYGSGLTADNTRLEWQNPTTKAWTTVPVSDDANGQIATFTADQDILVPALSTATIKLRITASAAVTGGRTLFRVSGTVPSLADVWRQELNSNQTYTTVVKQVNR